MDARKVKEARLAELKTQLLSVEGTPTEVYTRIVGYYRSVRNWNAGKREEFGKRMEFSFPGAESRGFEAPAPSEPGRTRRVDTGKPAQSWLLFTRRSCHNCPPVRDYLATTALEGHVVDVDADEGIELARAYDIMATPTAVLMDADGEECARAYTTGQLKAILAPVRESAAV